MNFKQYDFVKLTEENEGMFGWNFLKLTLCHRDPDFEYHSTLGIYDLNRNQTLNIILKARKELENISVLDSLVLQSIGKNSKIKQWKWIINNGSDSGLVDIYITLITQCLSSVRIITVYSV